MTHRRRAPRPIAGVLTGLRAAWQPASSLGRAQTAWDEIGRVWGDALGEYGDYVVARTELVALRAGVLTVRCTEAGVADTLTLESERVLARLNERLAGDPVTRLRCVTTGR